MPEVGSLFRCAHCAGLFRKGRGGCLVPHTADECCHRGDTLLGGDPEVPDRNPNPWLFSPERGLLVPRASVHLQPEHVHASA